MTKSRKNELKYICLAYNDKINKIKEFSYISGAGFGQSGGNVKTDKLEEKALKLIELKKQVEAIKQCCIKVFGRDDYQEALRNIAEGVPYECLKLYMSERTFRRRKSKFFKLLDKKI